MFIEHRETNVPCSEALRDAIDRRVGAVLRRFEHRVARVIVRLVHRDAPPGGDDTRCTIHLELIAPATRLHAHADADDVYLAVSRAANKLDVQLARIATRRRPPTVDHAPGPHHGVASPRPVISTTDEAQLRAIIDGAMARDRAAADALDAELTRARIVAPDHVPPTVVRLQSRVRYRVDGSDEEREVTVVAPVEADPARARVSVLAPIGAALIGLDTGDVIDWPMPGGQVRRFHVVGVPPPADPS